MRFWPTMSEASPPATAEVSTAFGETFDFRERLGQMFEQTAMARDDLLFNLGLFVRSSLLVKFLVMDDLYRRIKDIPGEIHEYGVWYGQNLVLMENLRAIHEPFNKQRRIVGFDTFEGYPEQMQLAAHATDAQDRYRSGLVYQDYLASLLEVHEGNNAFGHIRGSHRLVAGSVEETAPQYFVDHPEAIVALAYFDIGTYAPTVAALKAIRPNLVPGSVILFDELTWSGAPGEAIAFKEVFGGVRYRIEKCTLYPSKTIVTIS